MSRSRQHSVSRGLIVWISILILFVYAFLLWLIYTSEPPMTYTPVDLRYHGADLITEDWRGGLVAYRFDREKGVYCVMWKRRGNL